MRVSANPKDEGFLPYRNALNAGYSIHVSIDGEELSGSIVETADDHAGLVIAYVKDVDGNLVSDARAGEYVRKELRGRVRIWRERACR